MNKQIISQPVFGATKHLHMVGIGGIGMSGMAEILLLRGFKVSGSDGSLGETTERLEKLGAKIFKGHRAENIEGADVVVYTSAVKAEENVETKAALDKKIPVIKRSEMLSELMRMKYGIGIAGTHGKTTTTTLTGLVVRAGEFDPSIIVGGRVHSFDKTNAVVGAGDIFVVEADEYDRTFLKLSPSIVVVTNIDVEHLDIYKDEEDIKDAFVEFANKVPFYGVAILCLDDPNVRIVIPRIKRRIITYGLTPQALLRATKIDSIGMKTKFEVSYADKTLGEIELQAPGEHNVKNALAAIGVGLELGMTFNKIKEGISKYTGVFRRFQIKLDTKELMVVDDYAHHPTEVKATLQAARKGWPDRRLVAVFQPHLYSRTQQLQDDFGMSFFDADVLVVTDVYSSREEPIQGVNGSLIASKAASFGHKNVHYIENKADVPSRLKEITKSGDIVITMGAGDIYTYGEKFTSLIQNEPITKRV
jgi:UDP-N-acetylmuramate--alanine ligase